MANHTADRKDKPTGRSGSCNGYDDQQGRTDESMVSLRRGAAQTRDGCRCHRSSLVAENAATCDPPLPEDKVRAIAHDIPERYPNAPILRREAAPIQ